MLALWVVHIFALSKLSLDRLFVVVQCEQRRLSFTVKNEHNIDLRVGC